MCPRGASDYSAHFTFALGRSTRSSRNSSGPLVRCRRRWARSSGGAAGSMIFSIAFVARSYARAAPNRWLGDAFVLSVSPNSTRRRMASERAGLSPCCKAQPSTLAMNSSERRIVRTGSFPVAGRPAPGRLPPHGVGSGPNYGCFMAQVVLPLGFSIVVHAREWKRPPGRDTGRPLVRLPAPLRFRRG